MKFSKKQKLVIIGAVSCLICLVIIGGSLYEAITTGNWRGWFAFVAFGVGALIVCLPFLLSALGVLDSIIY